MKPEAIKAAFEALAEKMGYSVRYEKGDFRGGACRVDRDKQIIINAAAPLNHQNYAFARVFAEMDVQQVESHYLLPELRKMLDDIRAENERREAMDNYALD